MQLIIQTDVARQLVQLRLQDQDGNQLGYHCLELPTLAVSERRAMFDLGNFLHHYVAPAETEASIEKVGIAIANKLLGEQIFKQLWQPSTERTLRIVLPAATQDEAAQNLSADLARVPWESARPQRGEDTLAERNLSIQLQHQALASSAAQPLPLMPGETLRVLFVFAEAQGSQPLGMRRERRELLALFQRDIYPQRKVSADYLMHGVTRQRLQAQITENGGYHIIHWSGHGGPDVLELSAEVDAGANESPQISGAELVALLQQAGGYLPQLFYLSACDSGAVHKIQNWQQFAATAQEQGQPATPFAEQEEGIAIPRPAGFTGTAHALLQTGVPAVVAMRYAVGDAYALALAQAFYRALLAHEKPKNVAQALNFARRSLQEQGHSAQFYASDAATSVLFGGDAAAFCITQGRSPAADRREPRLHEIAELHLRQHASFIGRSFELASLGAHFIGMSGKPVAVIKGLGGMGKSALCAEVVDVWQAQFTWILLYQAKPQALAFEATLRDIHLRLKGELGSYQRHIEQYPLEAIHREADDNFNGEVRLQRLRQNLVRAMQAEAILLVLDNFETNLSTQANSTGQWNCQDPAWDACLALLAQELSDSGSRVLLTCRRPIAALPDARCHNLALGPLSAVEAALYLSEHPVLSAMAFGDVAEEWELAQRLLEASRFHPLLMDRLARLAAQPELREQLLLAINTLEERANVAQLPELFAGMTGDFANELAYLEDALAVSLDQLIEHVGIEARRLLWVISVANEPVELGLLEAVWGGNESKSRETLRYIQNALEILPQLPLNAQETLRNISPEILSQIQALKPKIGSTVEFGPLLYKLANVGLIDEKHLRTDDLLCTVNCHELVRERIRAWMDMFNIEKADWPENLVRLAYADQLAWHFNVSQHTDMVTALQAGSRAIVYCIQAENYTELCSFASAIVTHNSNPRLLQGLLTHLESAAESVPDGRSRWLCQILLADALSLSGRPDKSLPFYQSAALAAKTEAEAGGPESSDIWDRLGGICANAAAANVKIGQFSNALHLYRASAAAHKQGNQNASFVIMSELEALRIDIKLGKVNETLPIVEERLTLVAKWWSRYRVDKSVPEDSNLEMLARIYISALDIARQAEMARRNWLAALTHIDNIVHVKCELQRPPEDIALSRINRANVLSELERFEEAQIELESCLPLFQHNPAAQARTLSALATIFSDQNDFELAIKQEYRALAIRDDLPDPMDRAYSHANLALFFGKRNAAMLPEEFWRHQLASLAYVLLIGSIELSQHLMKNLFVFFKNVDFAKASSVVPTLSEVIARPEFNTLAHWLQQQNFTFNVLQTTINELIEHLRNEAETDK